MIIDWFSKAWTSNQFLVGTMTPVILAGTLYALKSTFYKMINWVKMGFSSKITIMNTTPGDDFTRMTTFLREKIVIERFQRNMTIDADWKYDELRQKFVHEPVNSIGYGNSWGFFRNSLILAQRSLIKDGASAINANKPPETINIIIFSFFPKKTMIDFMTEFNKHKVEAQKKSSIRIRKVEEGTPEVVNWKPYRSFDTMRMKESVKEQIKNHLTQFRESRESCEKDGLPWHTGILFHGKPGTGKTSMTHVIASYLEMDIAFFTGSCSITDTRIQPHEMILALEDIDALGINVSAEDRDEKKHIGKDSPSSLSEILNYLDGFITPHGLIVIATTNHIEKLDPAIIRKGRFDLIIDMDEAVKEEDA